MKNLANSKFKTFVATVRCIMAYVGLSISAFFTWALLPKGLDKLFAIRFTQLMDTLNTDIDDVSAIIKQTEIEQKRKTIRVVKNETES